ncbi:adhesive plaque matrix protein 2-like [Atheta coriaria]|uniref:adhesive plaque matrix protein 2-like n=1 Tax=Dalotia coriaria TaxID=877792 RepID=UPI0031F4775B
MRAIAVLLLFFVVCLHLCYSCEPHQRRRGCRINNGRCACDDFGCNTDYRYETFEECTKALRGKKSNGCSPNPCLHGGSCIQVSQSPGYKCRCEGTGYFGGRCNRACPKGGSAGRHDIFPYECIVI